MTLACRQRPWLWAALLFCGPSPALAQAQPPTAPPPDAGSSVAAPPATTARESYPDDPRLASALVMMSRGRFDAAEVTARTVLGQGAEVDRAAAILGIALLKQKKYEEARRYLERARDSKQPFPERRHAPHFLGWCCYHLGDLESSRAAFEQQGRKPNVRFKMPEARVMQVHDLIRGDVEVNTKELDDWVMLRPDGVPLYNFACVVDDVGMKITHVVRGEEHFLNGIKQRLLFEAALADCVARFGINSFMAAGSARHDEIFHDPLA
jgi:hypothetical protein